VKRKQLRAKDVNKVIAHLGIVLHKKDIVESVEDRIILVNKESMFFYYQEKLIPTLKYVLKESKSESSVLKQITVDMGAIKFVTSGADIMRPGIVAIDPGIAIDEAVVVVDEKHKKPLAIGIALVDSVEMEKAEKGKVVKVIHYVGDTIWSL
jgi:PUA-domain protein